ncbi:Cell division protein FtsZ [compost metagenome]
MYEVNEAAEIVIEASDPEVNMIFGAIIDENMKEDIKVTVIATGFEHKSPANSVRKPAGVNTASPEQRQQQSALRPFGNQNTSSDQLDIPTFLRNRSRNNNE